MIQLNHKVPLGRRRPRFSSSLFTCQRAADHEFRPTKKTDTPETAPQNGNVVSNLRRPPRPRRWSADLLTCPRSVNASIKLFSSLFSAGEFCKNSPTQPCRSLRPARALKNRWKPLFIGVFPNLQATFCRIRAGRPKCRAGDWRTLCEFIKSSRKSPLVPALAALIRLPDPRPDALRRASGVRR